MKPLDHDDRRHVEAAQGWCELHSFLEANAELDQVKPENRAHPDVLEARWQVYANLDKWEEALELASELMRTVPGRPEGFLYTCVDVDFVNLDCRTTRPLAFKSQRKTLRPPPLRSPVRGLAPSILSQSLPRHRLTAPFDPSRSIAKRISKPALIDRACSTRGHSRSLVPRLRYTLYC